MPTMTHGIAFSSDSLNSDHAPILLDVIINGSLVQSKAAIHLPFTFLTTPGKQQPLRGS
jgi:hypothetical protein